MSPSDERALAIWLRYKAGERQTDIARQMGISAPRVWQLCRKGQRIERQQTT